MDALEALLRVAYLQDRGLLPTQKTAAFLKAADVVRSLPDGELERYELYVNPDGSVAGMGVYPRSTNGNVLESASHYFDEQGNTVSVWFRMKWLDSGCTDSIAVETRYVYFHPPGQELLQYATLRDAFGNDLDGERCRFPDIERHFEAYYHRDMLLLFKHIPEQ